MIPETLPITERAVCFNGGIKDGCGATVEFIDGVALCPRCGVYQRYVKASADDIHYILTGKERVVSIGAKAL